MAGFDHDRFGGQMGVINPQVLEMYRQMGKQLDMRLAVRPPADPPRWVCSCKTENTGRFCTECGAPKPEELKVWRCAKCGFAPDVSGGVPNFCAQCGDRFTDEDFN